MSSTYTREDLRSWLNSELRTLTSSETYQRAKLIRQLLDIAEAPPWLADAAEALGYVRKYDGAPLALNWTQLLEKIRELREEKEDWKDEAKKANAALAALLVNK